MTCTPGTEETPYRGLQRVAIGLMSVAAIAALSVVAPPHASAHGIGGDAAQLGLGGFRNLGIVHMLTGWDHLLFVVGVLLIARDARRAVKLVSLFALGHSITLITATLAGWRVDPYLVDVAIVTSLVVVGGVALAGQPRRWTWFAAVVLGFGLVHGLGLATRFQALGVNPDGQIWKLLAFNIGIEIGQVTAIVATLSVVLVLLMALGRARVSSLTTWAAGALFLIGVVAAPAMVILARPADL